MIPRRWLTLSLFYGFWAGGVVLMAVESARHPYDPTLTGPARHGQGSPGELAYVLAATAAEIVVLTLILRPWSYERSWRRAVKALAVLIPWMGLWMGLSLGGGPATGMHALLLFALCVALAVAAVVSGFAARRATRDRATAPPTGSRDCGTSPGCPPS